MKCDELKDYDYDPDFHFQSRGRFYDADEVDAAIAELKQKLEDAGMRERRLKRALWMARAEKAKHIATFCYYALHYSRVPVRDIYQCQDKWDKVELKCIKKAKEFK